MNAEQSDSDQQARSLSWKLFAFRLDQLDCVWPKSLCTAPCSDAFRLFPVARILQNSRNFYFQPTSNCAEAYSWKSTRTIGAFNYDVPSQLGSPSRKSLPTPCTWAYRCSVVLRGLTSPGGAHPWPTAEQAHYRLW